MDTGATDASEVTFFGLKVPAKGFALQKIEEDGPAVELIHVTNVALGEKPGDGPHVVKISVNDDQGIVLGTLHRDRATQFPVDFILNCTTRIDNTGPSAVYLTGYRSITVSQQGFYSDEDMYSDDSEDEDDSEEAPAGVPLLKTKASREFRDACVKILVCIQQHMFLIAPA